MQLTKNQRFGLITFFVLIFASYLVTMEPWKSSSQDLETSMVPPARPVGIRIDWNNLSTGYPQTHTTDTIRSYRGFDLGYNETFEQASWVAYILTRHEIVSGNTNRTDNFRPDTSIATGSASLEDYRGSGFDRGHMAPAGDMKWDSLAMSESFLMSNISPQDPSFNRGVWRRLETQVRDWAVAKESLYVISGPVLEPVDSLIGINNVGVPSFYFKVLVDLSPPEHSFIAFVIPNKKSSQKLMDFAVSVDSLERITGYNFFAHAPDQEMVDWLEWECDLDSWD